MNKVLVTLSLVLAAPAALAAPVRLQALTPTSGAGATRVLDGSGAGWSPRGDATDEGLLFRFEVATTLKSVDVEECKPTGGRYSIFVNGILVGNRLAAKEGHAKVSFRRARPARSVFVKVLGGEACLRKVAFSDAAGAALAVVPPRQVRAQLQVTSVLSPQDAYHASYLFDARTDFGWVEGNDGIGVGERFTVAFAEPKSVAALELWNGYQRSKDHFRKNARAAEISVWVDGSVVGRFEVKDRMGAQKFTLDKPMMAKSLTVEITKAKQGRRYPDLVISEARFWDEAGAFTLELEEDLERRGRLLNTAGKGTVGKLVDRHYTDLCAHNRTLKLRSNHTFVAYQSEEDADGYLEEVFDGAWVPRTSGNGLRLYGRRHRVAQVWRPYGGDEEETTTRVAGGKLAVRSVDALGAEGLAELLGKWKKAGLCAGVKPSEVLGKSAFVIEGRALTGLFLPTAKR